MKHLTRVAAVTVATALAAAGLVGSAGTSANAAKAPLATSYTCTTAFGDFALPVTLSTNIPTTAKANKKVPAKNLTVDVTVPASIVSAAHDLLGVTGLGGSLAGDAKAKSTKIGLTGNLPSVEITDTASDLLLSGTGKTAAFKIAKAGNYVVKAPSSLSFTPTNESGEAFIGAISCALTPGSPSKLGTIKVTK